MYRDPDEPGELKLVAAVEAVLAGDQLALWAEGVKDVVELGVLGEALPASTFLPRTASILVLMCGVLGR